MKRTVILTSVLLLMNACIKEAISPDNGDAIVHITTSIDSESPATKAIEIPQSWNYGIFVCENGSLTAPHKANSWNLASYHYKNPTRWIYRYVDNKTTGALSYTEINNLTLTARKSDPSDPSSASVTADLYAYAPYRQGAYLHDPATVPFNTPSQWDVLYAEENASPSYNKGLDPLSASALSARFTFQHLCAKLVFNFKLSNSGSSYSLTNISVTNAHYDNNSHTAKLYKSGTFNAITGLVNAGDSEEVRSLNLSQEVTIDSHTTGNNATILLIPTQVADGDLVFSFAVDGQELQPFILQRDYLLHDDGITYGFQRGFQYTFYFTLDNYVFFDGFTVGSWSDGGILGEEDI